MTYRLSGNIKMIIDSIVDSSVITDNTVYCFTNDVWFHMCFVSA